MTRILWIDDEPNSYKIIANHMAMDSIDIYFAHGFDQINHYLNNGFHWDVVLLDGDMPLMNGVDVARDFLRERGIPVIIVSMNPGKVAEICCILSEYETPHYVASITDPVKLCDTISSITNNGRDND